MDVHSPKNGINRYWSIPQLQLHDNDITWHYITSHYTTYIHHVWRHMTFNQPETWIYPKDLDLVNINDVAEPLNWRKDPVKWEVNQLMNGCWLVFWNIWIMFPHINELMEYIIPPTRLLNMDFCSMKETVSGHSEVMVKWRSGHWICQRYALDILISLW